MISDRAGIDQSVGLVIEPWSIIERILANLCYRLGDVHASQALAASERPITDISYRVGNDDAGQPSAVSERIVRNT